MLYISPCASPRRTKLTRTLGPSGIGSQVSPLSWKGCSGTPKDAPSSSHSSPQATPREKQTKTISHTLPINISPFLLFRKFWERKHVFGVLGESRQLWAVVGRDWRRGKKGWVIFHQCVWNKATEQLDYSVKGEDERSRDQTRRKGVWECMAHRKVGGWKEKLISRWR